MQHGFKIGLPEVKFGVPAPLFFPGAAVNCVGQRAAEMGSDSIDILDSRTSLGTTFQVKTCLKTPNKDRFWGVHKMFLELHPRQSSPEKCTQPRRPRTSV